MKWNSTQLLAPECDFSSTHLLFFRIQQPEETDDDHYTMESSGPAPDREVKSDGMLDLLGLGLDDAETPTSLASAPAGGDIFGSIFGTAPAPPAAPVRNFQQIVSNITRTDDVYHVYLQTVARTMTLPASRGDGMQVCTAVYAKDGVIVVDFEVENQVGPSLHPSPSLFTLADNLSLQIIIRFQSPAPLSGFMIQFNKNGLNLKPAEKLNLPTINPGQKASAILHCRQEEPAGPGAFQNPFLQIAVKNNVGHGYVLPLHSFIQSCSPVR